MNAPKPWHVAVISAVLLGVGALLVWRSIANAPKPQLARTVADVLAEHAPVQLAGSEVRGSARLVDRAEVATGTDGRARLRLDDGALVVVDQDTRLRLRGAKLTLVEGRIFVQGSPSGHTYIELGDLGTEVASSSAAFALTQSGRNVYCAQGELLLRRGSQQTRVAAGERAVPGPSSVDVSPEAAFDDWTGGLAVPWAQHGAGRALVPELFTNEADAGGQRLSVRSQKIDVSIEGEFAVTRTRTSYFNGSEHSVTPQVRVALPEAAIVSRVARASGAEELDAQVAIQRPAEAASPSATPRLEWAGNGWLRGALPSVESGASVDLLLTYSEWLPTHGGRRTYRFPLAADEAPLMGELRAMVRASAGARFVSTNAGAELSARTIELAQSDVRPSADLVVELAAPRGERRAVRAYVQDSSDGDDPYVLFRAEVPERTEPGVSLAIVVDTSMSVGTGTLETERAVVEALLQGLGPKDEVVVLAADQMVRTVAQDSPRPVTAAFRAEVARALAAVRPGGASNLSMALERGADLLDADARGKLAGSGVLIYVGDGKVSMGETDAGAIRRRLAQRSGGMPRLASVAVGSGADRVFLARLTQGIGTFHEAIDRADAARVGSNLLADAMEPTLRGVDFDVGPNVDRVYPRDARAIVAGSTLSVVGRLRGPLPSQVGLTYRHGRERVTERRPVDKTALPAGADLPKRWARARIEEIAARGDGLEPTIALAASAGLITPWTGWFFEAPSGASQAPLGQRLLDFSPTRDAAFARHLNRELAPSAALLEPAAPKPHSSTLREAIEAAVRRILKQAQQSVRACRDARAAVRPEVSDRFSIDLALSDAGKILRLQVVAGSPRERDAVLERCVEGVLRSLPFAAYGIAVSVTENLKVPPLRAAKRTVCSRASRLSLPIRRAVWRERNRFDVESFSKAMQSCELSTFAEKREYLLLMMDASRTGAERLALARGLDEAGESDAAAFVRKEALRRVESFEELERLSAIIFSDEPNVDAEFEKAYAGARSDEARLDVVRKFLRIAPHAALLRRRLYALLEALGRKDELIAAIDGMRGEPIVDAGLLALGASALRRAGLDADGRRAFGELLERAPRDPWTLAFVGDRLRGERLFDEAAEAYESLQRIVPADAGVSLRLALAHAGAGRLDVATRLLESVTQTGGRDDDGRLGELAAITSAVLLANAREQATSPAQSAELLRRLAQTPLPDVASVLFIRSEPSEDPLQVRIAREHTERDLRAPEFNAPLLGLAAARVERGDGTARIVFSRASGTAPSQPLRAEVAALLVLPERGSVRIVRRDIELPRGATTLELRWNGEAFL